jgi:hypothetical protein
VKKQRGLTDEQESGLKLDLDSSTPDSYINLRINK